MQPSTQTQAAGAGSNGARQLSEAEVASQKRSLEYIADDAKRLANLNVHAPFSGMQDAIDRLLPFHALAHEDGEDADDEYVYSHEGAELVCSRQQAWQELSYRQALELSQRVDKVRRSVVKAQANYQAQKQRLLPEESMIINQMMLTVSKKLRDQAAQTQQRATADAQQAPQQQAGVTQPTGQGVPPAAAGNAVKQEIKPEPMILG